jgi:hypothetical protein
MQESSLNRSHHESQHDRAARRRNRRGARGERRGNVIPLTPEGVPAAVPDAPPVSPVVSVSADSRARYPWLPARVIAGSVWRGPNFLRVRVEQDGTASPWRCGAAAAR